MSDIVKRLNTPPVANHYYSPGETLDGPVLTERREAAAEIERLRHEMAPLAEAFYLRDVRGQIEVLHDQISSLTTKNERLRKAMTMIYDTLFLAGSLLGTEEAIKEAIRIAREELEAKP